MSSTCSIIHWSPGDSRSHAVIELIARRFALLSEPMRLRLVQALFEQEKSAGALIEEVRGTQANISRHLTALVQGGIVVRRKHGIHVRYALADSSIVQLCELVCGGLKQQLGQQVGALAGGAPQDGDEDKK